MPVGPGSPGAATSFIQFGQKTRLVAPAAPVVEAADANPESAGRQVERRPTNSESPTWNEVSSGRADLTIVGMAAAVKRTIPVFDRAGVLRPKGRRRRHLLMQWQPTGVNFALIPFTVSFTSGLLRNHEGQSDRQTTGDHHSNSMHGAPPNE